MGYLHGVACRLGGYRALAYSCRRVVAYVALVAQLLYGRGMPRPVGKPNFFGERDVTSALGRGMPRPYYISAPLVNPSFSVKENLLLLWVAACRDRTTLATRW